jgi:alpha-D-ribose 1-methylphosphonate 5-triphosphate synthase subunit PhnG
VAPLSEKAWSELLALVPDEAKRRELVAMRAEDLSQEELERREARAGRAARTKVEFFTLVRGEDA